MNSREVIGSPFYQGEDERIARQITVPLSWGDSPFTTLAFVLKDATDGNTDVTSAKSTGVISSVGNIVTTPKIFGIERYKVYRGEVKFTTAAENVEEFWFQIIGEI